MGMLRGVDNPRMQGFLLLSSFAGALALGLSFEAAAQMSGKEVNAAFEKFGPQAEQAGLLGGALGFGGIGEDYFVTLNLRLSFDREMWGFGVQAPVRFRVIDKDPKQDNDFALIRKEDWDEPAEIMRLIRYVYVGQRDKKGPFYVRVGELDNLSLGHGTLVHRYYNNVDTNTWHTGLNVAANAFGFGADLFTNDVVRPSLAGGRLSVRPFEVAEGPESFMRRLVFGFSLMADINAPLSLKHVDADNDPNTPETVQVNSKGEVQVDSKKTMTAMGVDVGFEVLDTEFIKITPYLDLNRINNVKYGLGAHLGVLWQMNVPVVVTNFVADLRTEYRWVSGDYLGPYFNASYDVERYQFLLPSKNNDAVAAPKLQVLRSLSKKQVAKHGYFFELLAGLPEWVYIGGEYIDYASKESDGYLRLSLEIPALEVVQLSAVYMRVNVDGPTDLFAFDEKSAFIAQATVPLYSALTLQARWWRVWKASANEGFEAVDDWSVGFGFSAAF